MVTKLKKTRLSLKYFVTDCSFPKKGAVYLKILIMTSNVQRKTKRLI